MTRARTSPEDHAPAEGDPDQATRHRHRPSKLFEKDHAYAARLVQIATAIRSVVWSTSTMNVLDQIPSEIQEDDVITAGILRQPRTSESGP